MSIEQKKLELQIKRVKFGVEELEFKIEERLDEVSRIEKNIEIVKIK